MAIDWSRRTFTKDEFLTAWYSSDSIKECALKLGLSKNGGTYKSLRIVSVDLRVTDSHMTRTKHYDNRTKKIVYKIPLERLLVENSEESSTSALRIKLLDAGIFEPICVGCKNTHAYNFITDSQDLINLQLDHINGINTDNRIENLRLLCPGCHSYTPTYCGKNRNKVDPNYCKCGKQIDRKSKQCIECRRLQPTKLSEYTSEFLVEQLIKIGAVTLSKQLGVSDSCIKKELIRRGVKPPQLKRGPKK